MDGVWGRMGWDECFFFLFGSVICLSFFFFLFDFFASFDSLISLVIF